MTETPPEAPDLDTLVAEAEACHFGASYLSRIKGFANLQQRYRSEVAAASLAPDDLLTDEMNRKLPPDVIALGIRTISEALRRASAEADEIEEPDELWNFCNSTQAWLAMSVSDLSIATLDTHLNPLLSNDELRNDATSELDMAEARQVIFGSFITAACLVVLDKYDLDTEREREMSQKLSKKYGIEDDRG